MKVDPWNNNIHFSSERVKRGYGCVIGLSPDLEAMTGYDDILHDDQSEIEPDDDEHDCGLLQSEQI